MSETSAEDKQTLRQFIFANLGLNYLETQESHKLMNPDARLKITAPRDLWTDPATIDLGQTFD